jgi:uncharacterized lipoprotein YmbA
MLKTRLSPVLLLLLSCALLTGCLGSGSKNGVRYYLVDPVVDDMSEAKAERQLAIELIDLHLPQYLQRFQLVTRNGENRLRFSDGNQWAENLRKNLLRTLAINLASRLSIIDIGTPLNRSASLPDYRIQVHIAQCELDRYGKVQLSARWQISNADEEEQGMHLASLQSDAQIEKGDYDQIVADMQALFAGLCDQISDSIMALEGLESGQ